ncbi:MAG: hypothetical protein KBT32_03055 [Bacteroidales bacterium]|nr:hypothetical protein [Candidatus Physcocola equi]
MKPVEIEFLMKDKMSGGVEKNREGVEQLLDTSRRLVEVIGQSGQEGEKASTKYANKLNALRQEVEKMSSSLKSMGVSEKESASVLVKSIEQNVKFVETQTNRIRVMEEQVRTNVENGNTVLADALKTELEAAESNIDEAYETIKKKAELLPTMINESSSKATEQKTESMRAQLRLVTNELQSTTVEYRNMSEAERNSAAGMELKRKIEELVKKASNLRDVMDDVNRQVKGDASDTKNFDAMAQGLNVVASSAGAAISVFEMFGAKQEELVNIQTKLQATLAISNALSVIQNNLQKESSLMIGIRTIQEKAHAAAISVRSAAEGRGIVVTKLATVAQAAFNAVANANPYVLLATAVLTVVGALVAFSSGAKEATEAEKKQREEGERLKKQQEEMSQALGKSAGEVEAKYRSLQQQWSRLRTEAEKNKWIKDNANKFHDLGLNVNSVADAEQVLVNMAPEVIAALKSVAEAEAYSELYSGAIKKRAEKWEHRTKSRATGDYYNSITDKDREQSGMILPEEWRNAKLGKGDYDVSYQSEYSNKFKLTKQGEEKLNQYRKNNALELKASIEKIYNEEVDFYSQKWEEATKKASAAKQKIPSNLQYNGDNKTSTTKEENKLAKELSDLQAKNRQAEIDQMKEGSEKKRAQLRLDYEKELSELANLEKQWRKAQNGGLSQQQESALTASRRLAKSQMEEGEKEIAKEEANQERARRKAEVQAMMEYLKEYGSFQQQKLAIAEEYAQKIAEVEASEADEATKQWQKKLLDKERQQKESNLSFENISRGIDWQALFGSIGDLTKEMMQPMIEQLKAWTQTEEYRNADSGTQQKVAELIQEMRKYVGTDNSMNWKALDNAIKNFTDSVATYDKAVKAENAAVKARDEGKQKLKNKEISDAEFKQLEKEAQELGDATATAKKDMELFGAALNRTSEEVANFTSGLTTALSNAKGWTGADGFSNVQNAVGGIDKLKGTLDSILPQMGDSMAKTIGTTVSSGISSSLGSLGSGLSSMLSSSIGGIIGIVAQIPRLILDIVGAIKNFITGVLNAITELISLRWIDDFVNSILNAIGDLIDAVFDLPDNLWKVIKSIVVDGIGGLLDRVIGRIGNILSFGALSHKGPSDWFLNSNEDEVAKTIDRLTKCNALLEQSIKDLTEEMKSARGASAIDASERAKVLQEATIKNYLQIAQAQAGYHSAHRSFDYYWSDYSEEQVSRLSKQIGRDWNGSIWNLTPEEMRMLRSNVDMWQKIQDTGKGGYGGRVAEKLNDYIEQAGKIQEITDGLYETLTTTTKGNVFDEFLNSLYEMADGSEDVMDNIAENWQKMVNRMAVNNLVGSKFQKELEGWYEELAKLNESRTNGNITDVEYRNRMDALKAEYDSYIENARRDLETLRTEGIVKETDSNNGVSQSGKAGAFTTMTQDQAGKLEGLFVSGQIHWASIDDKMTDVSVQMSEASDQLRQIATNTSNSASRLSEIKESIDKIMLDGLKMK